MQINFDNKINEIIKILALEAERFGVKIYFIGGLVRDVLMGKKPLDIDILVEGDAIEFVQSLGDFVQIKSLHKDFGTIKTQILDVDIDFASTRKEIYPISGCLPAVEKIGCKLEEDLIRRDFTINAMAFLINPNLDFTLVDKFSGQEDLKKGILRLLHDNSIIDDPTRILRGLDFELRFNFKFDSNAQKLIQEYLKAPNREGLSVDRVILTLRKLFCSPDRAQKAFREFLKRNYYKILFDKCDLNYSEIEKAVSLFSPENLSEVYINYIFAKNIEKKEFKNRVEIYKYFKTLNVEDLCVYWAKTKDDNAILYFNKLKNVELKISGQDLFNLGFKQGKIFGEIFDTVLEAKLADNCDIESFEDEIEFVKNNFLK